MMPVSLSEQDLARLYPAYLIVDAAGLVRASGPALRRHIDPRLGREARPLPAGFPDVARLGQLAAEQLALEVALPDTSFDLAGEVIPHDGGYLLALHLSPRDLGAPPPELRLSDFARSDPMLQAAVHVALLHGLADDAATATRSLAAEQQRSLELLRDMRETAGAIAHELNNLLSVVGLNCERISGSGHAEPVVRAAGAIREAARRSAFATREMMLLADQREDSVLAIALADFFARLSGLLQLLLPPGVSLSIEPCAGSLRADCRASALLACLADLLGAAGEACGGSGDLCLRVRQDSDRSGMLVLALACRDIALGGHLLQQPTRRRFTAVARRAGEPASTVAQSIAALGIEAGAGQGPDGLYEIRLLVPMARQPGRSIARPLQILVVDDEADALEALAELLEAQEHTVSACTDPRAARELIQRTRFDVLLTDVVMPDLSGYDLADLAESRGTPERVILMSGHSPDPARQNDKWLFLRKPIDLGVLAAALDRAIA